MLLGLDGPMRVLGVTSSREPVGRQTRSKGQLAETGNTTKERTGRCSRRRSTPSRPTAQSGTCAGGSDSIAGDKVPGVDLSIENIVALMEAAGSEQAAVVGDAEGGIMAIQFAATYPAQTQSLVLINADGSLRLGRQTGLLQVFRGTDAPPKGG